MLICQLRVVKVVNLHGVMVHSLQHSGLVIGLCWMRQVCLFDTELVKKRFSILMAGKICLTHPLVPELFHDLLSK